MPASINDTIVRVRDLVHDGAWGHAAQMLVHDEDAEGVAVAYLAAALESAGGELTEVAAALRSEGPRSALAVLARQEDEANDAANDAALAALGATPVQPAQGLRGLPQMAARIQRALGHSVGTLDVSPPNAATMTCAEVTAWSREYHNRTSTDTDIRGIEDLLDLDDLRCDWRAVHETCTGRSTLYARRLGALGQLELRLDKREQPTYDARYQRVEGRALWSATVRPGLVVIEAVTPARLTCEWGTDAREDFVLLAVAGVVHGLAGAAASLDDLEAEVIVTLEVGAELDDAVVEYWERRLGVR